MDTITILFEKGQTFAEKAIIKLQETKAKELFADVPCFSHCSIMIDSMVYQTHPAHGVMKSKFTEGGHPELRCMVETAVYNKDCLKAHLDFLVENENKYYKWGVVAQLIYMLTWTWLGNKKPTKFYCSKLVAYALGFKSYYKMDMLDIYLKLKSNENSL